MNEMTIIHIPHASVYIPEEYKDSYRPKVLRHEIDVMTDWFCDSLFDCGAERIVFPVSRLLCDVERFRDDGEEAMAAVGMGAVYENCSDLSPLRQVSAGEREAILRRYYDPHHRRLGKAVRQRLERYGGCLIADAHSFYPTPLPYEQDKSPLRPDFCIGTSAYHTPDTVAEGIAETLRANGYTVAFNTPFAGTIVPMEYYKKDARVHSVMIEVNRRLYLKAPGVKSDGFADTKAVLTECIRLAERFVRE